MASERANQREIWLSLGGTSTLFRVNTGRAWVSALGPKGVTRLANGDVILRGARPVALGLSLTNGDPVVGTPDLLGFTKITITDDMVGSVVPVFTGIEIKSDTGRASKEQIVFCDNILAVGGIAGIANSAESAKKIISGWYQRFKTRKLI